VLTWLGAPGRRAACARRPLRIRSRSAGSRLPS